MRWEEVCIPEGPFVMGADREDDGAGGGGGWLPAWPKHVVTLSRYCIDKYEITNRRLRRCIDGGGCRRPIAEATTCNAPHGSYTYGDAYLDYPAVYVDPELAEQVCAFEGKQLPSEAQWEKAARGGCEIGGDPASCDEADERPYPWGWDQPAWDRPNDDRVFFGGQDFPPVGSRPLGASPYGAMDMAGSVTEVILDCDPPSGETDPTQGYLACIDGCVDPVNLGCPADTWWRILRGGHGGCASGGSTLGLRVYDREVARGGTGHDGARCVRGNAPDDGGGEP